MSYNDSPFPPQPALLLPGQTGYSFGSWSDTTPATKLYVSRSASAAGTATLTVQVWEGPNPAAGQLLSTSGLTNVSNVVNQPITGVSLDASGKGTISYASAATVPAAVDAGVCLVPQAEIPVVVPVSLPAYGTAFELGSFGGSAPNGRTLTWQTVFPSAPSTVQVNLECAMANPVNPQFQVLDTSTSVTGDLRFVTVQNFQLVRLTVAACTGGNAPSIVGKVAI
jgi:hypothetical protein